MSVWWKLAYIITPSISFGIGIVIGIFTTWFEAAHSFGSWKAMYINSPMLLFHTFLLYSLAWSFSLASISTITLTIVLCNKKPWKIVLVCPKCRKAGVPGEKFCKKDGEMLISTEEAKLLNSNKG